VPPTWRALDLIFEAYAILSIHEPDVAALAMTAAVALGARLGLDDRAIFLMGKSAAAEVRRSHIAS
jgi:hypothetical protein